MTNLHITSVLPPFQEEELYLVAPCDGGIGQGPKIEDIGKTFEGTHDQSSGMDSAELFTIYETG